jgi:hypothetical protein
MSERPEIALLRRICERIRRGGFAAINPDEFDRDFELVPLNTVDNPEVKGLEGWERWRSDDFGQTFELISFEVVEVVDLGDDALVRSINRQRGRGSGVELTVDVWARWSFKDGRAARCVLYGTQAEAEAGQRSSD